MGLAGYLAARGAQLAQLGARSRAPASRLVVRGSPVGLVRAEPAEELPGRWEGAAPSRRQVSLSALAGGSTLAFGNFGAGTPAGSQVRFAFETPAIPYASFTLLGFEVTGWISGDDGTDDYPTIAWPDFGQLSVVVNELRPRGWPNLVYREQQLALGGPWGQASAGVFDGIRDNSPIRRLNRVAVRGYVTNPFAIPASPVGNKITFALAIKVLLDVQSDDVFELSLKV